MQYFVFSVYGGAGSGGQNIQVGIKRPGVDTADSKQIAVKAGEWQDIRIPLTDFNSPAEVTEIFFQDTGWAGTVYIDQVGFQ